MATTGRSRGGRARPAASGRTWREAVPAPVVLVTGTERLLGERAVTRVTALAREKDPDLEVTTLDAADHRRGALEAVASPSLFGEARLAVVTGVEAPGEGFEDEVLRYLAHPADDVVLVLRHAGGQRAKKVLEAARAAPGAVVVDCPPVKRDDEKLAFVGAEMEAVRRRISAQGARALVDAVGSDLRELAASCAQLVADTSGTVDVDDVQRYYGGRVEATGFRVADAVVAGHRAEALALVRQAVGTGLDPVPIVAVLALRLRQMALVAGTRGRGDEVARVLGMQPWMVDRTRRELRGWTPAALGAGVVALAEADEAVKGGGRDPVFALERVVLRLCDSHER
ncbi:DNA polymerase III subunit delta [Pseudokineococcus basanitobsidens]|uniref:DNA-directed DNA polymerase n=1 Tax=Pseudokineococcus basanitobsidens TaxID=1926649 RepID=A0ABU8RL41_9ACTN